MITYYDQRKFFTDVVEQIHLSSRSQRERHTGQGGVGSGLIGQRQEIARRKTHRRRKGERRCAGRYGEIDATDT